MDVAGNGHCGWLAGYAALYNATTGLLQPVEEVVEATNMRKKDILNGMVATFVEEVRLHPENLDAELEQSGIRSLQAVPQEVRICALANHYAAQRAKSVKSAASTHFWVHPSHTKGMAIHARETIYVLDVDAVGNARMQAYAYSSVALPEDDCFDTGILPPVLVLRWQVTGNHFQAVVYDDERYEGYLRNLTELSKRRNDIVAKHGWAKMDFIQYNAVKTAKAVTKQLRLLRKASKASERFNEPNTLDGTPFTTTTDAELEMKRAPQMSDSEYESQCQGREGARQEGTNNTEPTGEVAVENKFANDTRVADKKTTEEKKVANGITRSSAEPTRGGTDLAMGDVENRGAASSSVTHHEV
ncbi:hypothetical protein PF002_g17664 [Phytophthora fragariae]|uniref:OTU domain-containing protein n=1 Tax=Phytophthora fragariae TaxID=53985 RepID=A0A6A3FAR9_9STRA|nr:hypothetical protein PF009_g7858 [Phytophthora fragariae]KAE9214468.1 hypothetical protein PF002_g17664 [Phytophthora fragariae]